MSDVSVFKDPGFGLGQRVKKVLDKYSGSWLPAKLNSRPLSSYNTHPVTFVVEEEGPEECVETTAGELIL